MEGPRGAPPLGTQAAARGRAAQATCGGTGHGAGSIGAARQRIPPVEASGGAQHRLQGGTGAVGYEDPSNSDCSAVARLELRVEGLVGRAIGGEERRPILLVLPAVGRQEPVSKRSVVVQLGVHERRCPAKQLGPGAVGCVGRGELPVRLPGTWYSRGRTNTSAFDHSPSRARTFAVAAGRRQGGLGHGQPRSRIGATTASVTTTCAGALTSQPM
jgi:hypothetical protein